MLGGRRLFRQKIHLILAGYSVSINFCRLSCKPKARVAVEGVDHFTSWTDESDCCFIIVCRNGCGLRYDQAITGNG